MSFLWNGKRILKLCSPKGKKRATSPGPKVKGEVIRYEFLSESRQYTLITLFCIFCASLLFEEHNYFLRVAVLVVYKGRILRYFLISLAFLFQIYLKQTRHPAHKIVHLFDTVSFVFIPASQLILCLMQICDAPQLQWHAVIPFFQTDSTDTDAPLERLLNLASQRSLFPTVQISHKFSFFPVWHS